MSIDSNTPYETVVTNILDNYTLEIAEEHQAKLLEVMKAAYNSKLGAEAHMSLPPEVFVDMLQAINNCLAEDWKGFNPFSS